MRVLAAVLILGAFGCTCQGVPPGHDAGDDTGGGSAGTGGGDASVGGGAAAGGGVGGLGGGSVGGGGANACDGVTCNTPPAKSCFDAETLQTWDPAGTCDLGQCAYTKHFMTCANGCQQDACVGDPCAGVTCTTPPNPVCFDSTTLKRFNATGACGGGACTYASSMITCAFGCVGNACANDPCAGVSCTQPPATYCLDPNTQRSFSSSGSCAGGGCTYAPTDTTCPYGCAQGACRTDPCANVMCTQPPARACVSNGAAARVYATSGTCGGNGACSYAFTDIPCSGGCNAGFCNAPLCGSSACNQSPTASCLNATTLRTYAPVGTCDAGQCGYQAIDVTCSNGCLNTDCLAGSWRREAPPAQATSALTKPSLAFDPAGGPHIVGCAGNSIEHHWRDDTGWHREILDMGVVTTACYSQVAVDATGSVMATWFDAVNSDLRFGRRVNGAWVKEVVKSTGTVGSGATMTLDATGAPVLAAFDGLDVVVFQKVQGSWVGETAITKGSGDALTLRYSQGTLHLAVGLSWSVATSSGNYDQPPAVLAVRGASGWSTKAIDDDGMLAVHALGFDTTGTPLVAYGVVTSVGSSDYERTRAFLPARAPVDTFVAYESNLLGIPGPMLFTDGARQPVLCINSLYGSTLAQRVNGAWKPTPALPTLGQYERVADAALRSDGALVYLDTSLTLVEPAPGACQKQCAAATCGDDGCGGSCGSCGPGTQCTSDGTCTTWKLEPLPGPTEPNQWVRSSAGEYHALGRDSVVAFYLRRSASGVWSSATRPFGTSGLFAGPDSLAVDPSGNPLVAALSGAGISIFSPASDGGWQSQPLPGPQSGRFNPILTAHADGQLDVFTTGNNATWGTPRWIEQVHFDGGTWSDDYTALGTSDDNYSAPSAVVDASGRVHVAWVTCTTVTPYTLKFHYAVRNGASWTISTPHTETLSFAAASFFVQLRVDASGAVHALSLFGGAWSWGVESQGSWTFETIPSALTLTLTPIPAFAVTPQGQPVIGLDKLFRRTAASTWTPETLPVSYVSTLGIDPDGTVHVTSVDNGTPLHLWK